MIELDNENAIDRDKYQWIHCVRRYRNRGGEKVAYWRPVGFYAQLDQILESVVQERVSVSDYEDMQSFLLAYKTHLTQLCTSLGDGLVALLQILDLSDLDLNLESVSRAHKKATGADAISDDSGQLI